MNEYLLSLAGFTPEQWEEFRGKIANKFLFWWQRGWAVITSRRVKIAFGVLGIVLIFVLGARFLISIWSERFEASVPKEPEATETAVPRKNPLEAKLELLRRDVEFVFDKDSDLLYPSLEVKVEF